ncbi:MAG: LysR family transcriptional regulator, partial [Siculibacillus sp.]|nr:LysR family transcriptional regulator [Siculibacillus sp.]
MADLDIDLLRTFVALAETESFTGAGERLGATQSAVSVRLKKLEDRLGHRLFDRTPRSVAPTPFG